MTCQHIILHRLKNTKPKHRRERCGCPAGARVLPSYFGSQRIWLCRKHWNSTYFCTTNEKKSIDTLGPLLQDT